VGSAARQCDRSRVRASTDKRVKREDPLSSVFSHETKSKKNTRYAGYTRTCVCMYVCARVACARVSVCTPRGTVNAESLLHDERERASHRAPDSFLMDRPDQSIGILNDLMYFHWREDSPSGHDSFVRIITWCHLTVGTCKRDFCLVQTKN